MAELAWYRVQAFILLMFTALTMGCNIVQGIFQFIPLYSFIIVLFIVSLMLDERKSILFQAAIIFLTGIATVIVGDQIVGLIFIVVALYEYKLITEKPSRKQIRYLIIFAITLGTDIVKLAMDNYNIAGAFAYSGIAVTAIIIIDNVIEKIIEKERQKVRNEMKELSDLIKRFEVTTKELTEIIERDKHHGVQ